MKKAPFKAESDIGHELLAQLQRVAAMSDEEIDRGDPDAPELDWSQPGSVRGKFYRPIKKLQSLRIDADILHHFQAQGPGYQTRINAALRAVMLEDLRRDQAQHDSERQAKR